MTKLIMQSSHKSSQMGRIWSEKGLKRGLKQSRNRYWPISIYWHYIVKVVCYHIGQSLSTYLLPIYWSYWLLVYINSSPYTGSLHYRLDSHSHSHARSWLYQDTPMQCPRLASTHVCRAPRWKAQEVVREPERPHDSLCIHKPPCARPRLYESTLVQCRRLATDRDACNEGHHSWLCL